jgi:hypothetical protein
LYQTSPQTTPELKMTSQIPACKECKHLDETDKLLEEVDEVL